MNPETFTTAYGLFRIGWVTAALVGCLLLWRRPRPERGLALVVGLFATAWLAYRLPLVGSYALPGVDRRLNLGSAASVAAGNPPWGNVQVGVAALEPFWDVVGAALALFNPANVIRTYDYLSPLAIVCVSAGLYFGLRARPNSADATEAGAWERVLLVLSVLGLSSFSLSNHAPLPPFFTGNFMHKPNHATGFGVLAVALGIARSRAPFWLLGLVLGLLSWVFLVHWAYLIPILVLAELLLPRGARRWARLSGAFALSLLVALPHIANLAREYSPMAKTDSALGIWKSGEISAALAQPHWLTLDLGLLLVLAVFGVATLLRRRTALDGTLLAMFGFACAANGAQAVLAHFGIAPEVDELYYFLRFAAAVAAAIALAAFARHIETWKALTLGRGHVLVLATCIPLTFPAYWDPPTMDKLFNSNIQPLPSKIVAAAEWIRAHTRGDAVFVASFGPATLIPALTGRRVLLLGNARPPADYEARRRVVRALLRERAVDKVQQATAEYGVTHVLVDRDMREEYSISRPACDAAFELAYSDRNYSIYALRKAPSQRDVASPR